jgi:hypothetical protein
MITTETFLSSAKKYQFFTRSESGPKYRVFNARSPRTNVGFFNRHKPQADGTNLDVRFAGMEGRNTVK